jgi:hypothetical protein
MNTRTAIVLGSVFGAGFIYLAQVACSRRPGDTNGGIKPAQAQQTPSSCTKWEVRLLPITVGAPIIEEGWEPFGLGNVLGVRRCAK